MIQTEVVKALLKKNGLSVKELSDKVFYSESAVSRWINGNRVPPSNVLGEIAKALGCTIDEIWRA